MNPENASSFMLSGFSSSIPHKDLKLGVQAHSSASTRKDSTVSTPEQGIFVLQSQTDVLPLKSARSSPFISNPSSPNKELLSDRFIPIRAKDSSKILFELSDQLMTPPEKLEIFSEESRNKMKYNSLLENQLLDVKHSEFFSKFKNSPNKSQLVRTKSDQPGHSMQQQGAPNSPIAKPKMLLFKTPVKQNTRKEQIRLSPFMDIEKEEQDSVLDTFKPYRKISKVPYKILDAPCLVGDFYLQLIHWSARNQLAVSLGNAVWLWSGDTGSVSKFCFKKEADLDYTAVQWDPKGNLLAVGDGNGVLELWDFDTAKMVFQAKDNLDRIDCISWNNPNIFSTGSRDASILTYDIRVKNEPVAKYLSHSDEVCGLQWSPNGSTLASGGNDNKVFLWNIRKHEPEAQIDEHTSAVKAIAWSPHQRNLLLTGGGYTDKTIRVWNTLSMSLTAEIYTGAQVCNLLFSKNSNEFVSTHGLYGNQIIVWKYPELAKICVIDGPHSHSERVLYLSDSPNGENIVTGASDETLKFWNIFPPKETEKKSILFPSVNDLR